MTLNAQLNQLIGLMCVAGSAGLAILTFAVVVVTKWIENWNVTD